MMRSIAPNRRPSRRRRLVAVAGSMVLGLSLLVGGVLRAQVEPPEPGGIDPESIYGRDNTQSVYVRDSAVVVERIALAERMERLQEWNKAAELYQEILEQYADRVLPSQTDAENKIYQYASVALAVQGRLGRWPAAGLEVYNARFAGAAAELLAEASPGDVAKLHRVLSRYFVTDAALEAGIRLVELYLESGDFSAASWIGQQLLSQHPAVEPQKPMLLYRVAIAQQMLGDVTAAKATQQQLGDRFAEARGIIAGEEVLLAESLARQLAGRPPTLASAAGDSWPVPFGDNARSRVPPEGTRSMVRTASIALTPAVPRGVPVEQSREYERQRRAIGDRGQLTGILPVVDDGELFFQDNASIYAVSISSGLPLPGWAATYGGERGGAFSIDGWTTPLGVQLSVALTDTEVFGVLGQPDPLVVQTLGIAAPVNPTLVSLERKTGRKRWAMTLKSLPLPDSVAASVRELQMVGTPMVVGEQVYVLARGGRGKQFDEMHVLCFAREDGAFQWGSYLASAGSGVPAWGEDMLAGATNVAQLAYASGRVFALTNLGAVAAIDAYDGKVVWLSIYPRPAVEALNPMQVRRRGPTGGSNKPFLHNPVLVKDGHVFVLPSDAEHLFVYDAGSGIEVNRLKLSHFGNANMLLGVANGVLVLAGDQVVFAVDWRKYDRDRYNPDRFDETLRWKSANIARPNESARINDPIRGRGFVTEKTVYIPTLWEIRRFSLGGGRLEGTYPAEGTWDEEESAGNLLVLPEHLIVASAERINVYTDPSVIRARLDREEQANPGDPNPRISSAEVLFVAGDRDAAIGKLDEARQLIGDPLPAGEARSRLFAVSMTLAQKLLNDLANAKDLPERIEITTLLLDRAQLAADGAEQQVQYRLARARLAEAQSDPKRQVTLYQEILSDPGMRVVPASDGGMTVTAAIAAESSIAQLVAKHGSSVYAPIEQEASVNLATAKQDGSAEALLAVAETFPNASVAVDAIAAAAAKLEADGAHLQATQVLRRLLSRNLDDPRRASVLEGLARNYLRLPARREIAMAQLRQASRLTPDKKLDAPLPTPDGKTLENVTLAQALESLRAAAAASVAQSLPDFGIVVVTAENRDRIRHREPFGKLADAPTAAGVESLAVPVPHAARLDRVVGWGQKKLKVFSPDNPTPILEVELPIKPVGSAWMEQALVVWSEDALASIDTASGRVTWQTPLAGLGAVDAAGENLAAAEANAEEPIDRDRLVQMQRLRVRRFAGVPAAGPQRPMPNTGEQVRDVRIVGDRLIVNTTAGRVAAMAIADGAIAWQARVGDRGADRVEASDDFYALLVRDELMTNLLVLDPATGQPRFRRTLGRDNGVGIANFAMAIDGTLVYLTADRLIGKDLYDPQDKPSFQTDRSVNENMVFMNTTQPGQMVIADGRILVMAFAGLNQQSARAFSLADGKPVRYRDEKTRRETVARFNPEASTSPVTIHAVGSRMYLVGARTVVCYELDSGVREWSRSVRSDWTIREVFIGRDYLVVLDQVKSAAENRIPQLQLNAYSRQLVNGVRQSGNHDYAPLVDPKGGIVPGQWQAASGGIVLRTGDNQLLLLRGQAERKD